MKVRLSLVVALLAANACAGSDGVTNFFDGLVSGQSPEQALSSTNAGGVVVLTVEEARKIAEQTRTIEMSVPTACGIGGEVLLQNAWGMIPSLTSAFGFGSIALQKERLSSIPDPIMVVVLSTNAVEELRKGGVTGARDHFLGAVVRATGKVGVLEATNAVAGDRRMREFVVIRVNRAADIAIQKK